MNDKASTGGRSVAVTGLGMVCALGSGVEETWQAVVAGASGIRKTERIDTSQLSCHYSGEVVQLGTPKRKIRGRTDRAVTMAMVAADEAVAASGLPLDGIDPYRLGVALGTSVGGLASGEKYYWDLLSRGDRPSTPPTC